MTLDLNAIKARRYDWWNHGAPTQADAAEASQQAVADRDALLQEIERLTAERDEWEMATEAMERANGDLRHDAGYQVAIEMVLRENLAAAEARAQTLREALEKYGNHKPGCMRYMSALSGGGKCTCGYDAALGGA